ncbi:MAG: hypothetical protein V2A56_13110 [bacterium]
MKTKSGFEVPFFFVSSVPPLKGEEEIPDDQIKYHIYKSSSRATDYISDIFDHAKEECRIKIDFISLNGNNGIHDIIYNSIVSGDEDSRVKASIYLSKKLSYLSDERNKDALLIIMLGIKNDTYRVFLARFPASIVLANKGGENSLDLEVIEKAFASGSKYFKAAVFEDVPSVRGFWRGQAIDKQVNGSTSKNLSVYWIYRFLEAQPSINSYQGTEHLATKLRNFVRFEATLEQQNQIVSIIPSVRVLKDEMTSMNSFCDRFFSKDLSEKVRISLGDEYNTNTPFTIDVEKFISDLGITVYHLDNGVTLSAPTEDFNTYVEVEVELNGNVKYIVTGQVKDLQIQKQKVKMK